jgi:16S rRNA processing protein RimM
MSSYASYNALIIVIWQAQNIIMKKAPIVLLWLRTAIIISLLGRFKAYLTYFVNRNLILQDYELKKPGLPQFALSSSTTNNAKETLKSGRKAHQNKYSTFSKRVLDPLEEAIQNTKSIEDQKAIIKSKEELKRGTTIPTNYGSTNVTKGKSVSVFFSNISKIIPSDPYTFGYIRIGSILGPHGVKGELKVKLETDFAESRIQPNSLLFIKKTNRRTPRAISVISGRKQVDDIYLLQFDHISSRTAAAVLKNYDVYVKTSDRPALGMDEYLVRELVGLLCYVDSKEDQTQKSKSSLHPGKLVGGTSRVVVGEVVGVVPAEELCSSAAMASLMHAMLEVRKINSKELCLIPFVPSIVLSVDLAGCALLLDPPKGLLQLTYMEKEKEVAIKGFLPERAALHLNGWERRELETSAVATS